MSARGKKKEENPTPDNVDQIRDIIFGGVMQDYEARFKALAADFEASSKSMRKDFEARLDALTKQLEREAGKAADRLEKEIKDRKKAVQSLSSDLDEAQEENQAAQAQLQTRLDDEADTLRHELEQLRTQLLDRISDEVEALRERMQSLTSDLDQRKVSREELAGLLTEVALRLKGDLKLPKTKKK